MYGHRKLGALRFIPLVVVIAACGSSTAPDGGSNDGVGALPQTCLAMTISDTNSYAAGGFVRGISESGSLLIPFVDGLTIDKACWGGTDGDVMTLVAWLVLDAGSIWRCQNGPRDPQCEPLPGEPTDLQIVTVVGGKTTNVDFSF